MRQVALYWRLTIRDREGRVISRTRRRRARSFVKQYLQLLLRRFSVANVTLIKDTGGTDRTNTGGATDLDTSAAAGDATHGPVVGTGSTGVSLTDYALAAQIAHGVGAGQLQYQATSFGAVQVGAAIAYFTVTRVFINGSGATITINEVGMYSTGYCSDAYYYFLTVRDLVSGGQAVPDGGAATLEYTVGIAL